MLLLTESDINNSITMLETIKVLKDAFSELSLGKAIMPPRRAIYLEKEKDKSGLISFMPGYLPGIGYAGIKVGSVMPGNINKNLPLIHALVILIDINTGKPIVLMDGKKLTSLRTGAASGVATDVLSRKNSKKLAVIGSGVQARAQIEAVCNVRDIKEIYIYSRTQSNAEKFAKEIVENYKIDTSVFSSIHETVVDADIICTATTSQTPILFSEDVKPGVHINSVGGHTKESRELSSNLLDNNYVAVEQYEASKNESCEKKIVELGEIITGLKKSRITDDEITIFSSVGVAIEDIAVAGRILELSIQKGLGQNIEI